MSCRLSVCFCRLYCILELKTAEGRFFHRVHLCIWAIGGHELGTLSIRVHNSLTVHDYSWALKFENFCEFQNVLSEVELYYYSDNNIVPLHFCWWEIVLKFEKVDRFWSNYKEANPAKILNCCPECQKHKNINIKSWHMLTCHNNYSFSSLK